VPLSLQGRWWARHLDHLGLGLLLAAGIALPLLVTRPSSQLVYSTVLAFALCATSLTVLTGWAGQLSLGQMGFAGLGALLAAALARGLETELGLAGVSLVRVDLPPLTFPTAVVAAACAMAALAGLIGVVALRVKGLLLAVVTFAFGLAAAQYLYRRPALSDGASSSVRFPRTELWGVDLADQRTYYYVVLTVLVVVLAVMARLRATGVGRSTIAVRDNPTGAAAFTVSPFRSKVVAFALSGGLAGLGGALLAGAVASVPLTERFFQVEDSLALVAIVVIGGLGSTSGPVLGAVWVVGLPALFPDNELVPLFASSLGLLVLLLYLPGGLVDIPHRLRAWLFALAEARIPVASEPPRRVSPPAAPKAETVGSDRTALAARDVLVRFGGNVAVDGASIELRQGEVVGLIGANGAGKSTLLNAIGGFVSATGSIELDGRDLTHLSAPRRAKQGLGRTFQAAPLFPTLTVRESILVALEARGRNRERGKRSEAADLIDLVGLGPYADKAIAELSTGTRRIVELACLLALGAKVLCLDEPTAGIAQRETEALAPLLVGLRADLDASMIVIEHDMPFIRSISDRLYCLEAGQVIASGDPDSVCADPRVIASYLGTDPRAIDRSTPSVTPAPTSA
jgi:ABC-type branched-subunit amino acid transport system ATPase component/ABC-type branched-subunit amino acid transport system permease subunit